MDDLIPHRGNDTYRIGDSDDLVVMENIGVVPSGTVCLQEHGIFLICTEGRAQFEYDGSVILIKKNDLFLYIVRSVASNFITSSDFLNRRPSTIIMNFTMKAIEHRLRFTHMTMQEIAYDLRFPNPSFFGQYCKEHLGMTPLEYRMKYHKGA